MLEVIRRFSISILFGLGFALLSTIYVGGIWDWVNGLLFIISLYFLFFHPLLTNKNRLEVKMNGDRVARNRVIGYFLQVIGYGIGYCIRFIVKEFVGW